MKVTATRRNAQLDNLTAQLNNGFCDIYSGTKPTDADTALSGNTLLASLGFGATAFGSASAGSATANAITQDSAADATGTATFARLYASNHTTVIADITVGTSGAELNLNTTSIVAAVAVQISSLVLSQPNGA
jgi:hypothetical protein